MTAVDAAPMSAGSSDVPPAGSLAEDPVTFRRILSHFATGIVGRAALSATSANNAFVTWSSGSCRRRLNVISESTSVASSSSSPNQRSDRRRANRRAELCNRSAMAGFASS